jgi:hypothetical protein
LEQELGHSAAVAAAGSLRTGFCLLPMRCRARTMMAETEVQPHMENGHEERKTNNR